MSDWSTTQYLTKKIFNTFDLNDKADAITNKLPIIASAKTNTDGSIQPVDTDIDNLTIGTTWFIVEEK